jgi:hypothetical protein
MRSTDADHVPGPATIRYVRHIFRRASSFFLPRSIIAAAGPWPPDIPYRLYRYYLLLQILYRQRLLRAP